MEPRPKAKTNSHLYELLTCLYIWLCTTVVHNTAQNSLIIFPFIPLEEVQQYMNMICMSTRWLFGVTITLGKSTKLCQTQLLFG